MWTWTHRVEILVLQCKISRLCIAVTQFEPVTHYRIKKKSRSHSVLCISDKLYIVHTVHTHLHVQYFFPLLSPVCHLRCCFSLQALSGAQLEALGPDNAAVVTSEQQAALSEEQKAALQNAMDGSRSTPTKTTVSESGKEGKLTYGY